MSQALARVADTAAHGSETAGKQAAQLIHFCKENNYALPTNVVEIEGDPLSVLARVAERLPQMASLGDGQYDALVATLADTITQFTGAMTSGLLTCRITYQNSAEDIPDTIKAGFTHQRLAFTEDGGVVDSGIKGKTRDLTMFGSGYKVDDSAMFMQLNGKRHVMIDLLAKAGQDDRADNNVLAMLDGLMPVLGDLAADPGALRQLVAEITAQQQLAAPNDVAPQTPVNAGVDVPAPVEAAVTAPNGNVIVAANDMAAVEPAVTAVASAPQPLAQTATLAAPALPAIVQQALTTLAERGVLPPATVEKVLMTGAALKTVAPVQSQPNAINATPAPANDVVANDTPGIKTPSVESVVAPVLSTPREAAPLSFAQAVPAAVTNFVETAPITRAPAPVAPAAVAPSVAMPVSAPTAASSYTSYTAAPVVSAPAAPSAPTPIAEAPRVEAPVQVEQKVEQPKVEQKIEQPKQDDTPKAEEPKKEELKKEEPVIVAPVVVQPVAQTVAPIIHAEAPTQAAPVQATQSAEVIATKIETPSVAQNNASPEVTAKTPDPITPDFVAVAPTPVVVEAPKVEASTPATPAQQTGTITEAKIETTGGQRIVTGGGNPDPRPDTVVGGPIEQRIVVPLEQPKLDVIGGGNPNPRNDTVIDGPVQQKFTSPFEQPKSDIIGGGGGGGMPPKPELKSPFDDPCNGCGGEKGCCKKFNFEADPKEVAAAQERAKARAAAREATAKNEGKAPAMAPT